MIAFKKCKKAVFHKFVLSPWRFINKLRLSCVNIYENLSFKTHVACTQPTITCSKLTTETVQQGVKYIQTIKTPKRCQWRRSGALIVNFEYISHLVLVFPRLTLSR